MKKIMFNEKYGLTQAVLEGRKTMTRRIVKNVNLLQWLHENDDSVGLKSVKGTILSEDKSSYKVGEIVAIAQRYSDIYNEFSWLNLTKGWNNKIFVKAFYMPHQIKITDIKVERLQDISDEDCLKEGIFKSSWNRYYQYTFRHSSKNYHTPLEAFAALIDKVSGKGTWDSNPWVFAYEFKLVKWPYKYIYSHAENA